MINTFYGANTLATPGAFLAALFIGFVFGFALERAGFGSSKKLAGIFYFRDMTVLKVMFSGLIVAMLGLYYAIGLGFISIENLYLMPTKYGAQILGGFVFGIGFVLGGWCPGTAAVGIAAGRVDGLVFLGGAFFGSLIFNETYSLVEPLMEASSGVVLVYDSLGLSSSTFAFIFTLIAIAAFWFAEFVEFVLHDKGKYWGSRFLKGFSVLLITFAFGTFAFQPLAPSQNPELKNLAAIEAEKDHLAAEVLADWLMDGKAGLVLVDVRPSNEFHRYHLPGAINLPLDQLAKGLAPHKNKGTIVLYSNGMVHPAQARDALVRLGFGNVLFLTDGLTGFREEILKPLSLRREPLSAEQRSKINKWRSFFSK